MPELPEVETIARFLRLGGRGGPALIGKRLIGVRVLWDKTIQAPKVCIVKKRISGQHILAVSRRAKYLVIELSDDFLLIHLRMSGDLRVEPEVDAQGEKIPFRKHDRVVFLLEGDLRLVFEDARKFGRIWLVKDPADVLRKIGPEPLDSALSSESFHALLSRRKRQIKPLLLDQTFIAGLGNIYTDEALHIAKIHPLQLANQMDVEQTEHLLKAIRQVLLNGIEQNGASIDWVYRGGNFQNSFQVYQRAGEPCNTCGSKIQRIVVGQRGTHFCPVCQSI